MTDLDMYERVEITLKRSDGTVLKGTLNADDMDDRTYICFNQFTNEWRVSIDGDWIRFEEEKKDG